MATDRKIERAEPSRGAPNADYLQKIDKLTSLLDTIRPGTGGAINFLLRDAYKAGHESGHVVLLEALRPFADLMDEEGLAHMEECHFGSGDFVIQAADIRRARAAIKQAERT